MSQTELTIDPPIEACPNSATVLMGLFACETLLFIPLNMAGFIIAFSTI